MKQNISGVSRNLTLGRGASFYSDNTNLIELRVHPKGNDLSSEKLNRSFVDKITSSTINTGKDKAQFSDTALFTRGMSIVRSESSLLKYTTTARADCSATTTSISGITLGSAVQPGILDQANYMKLSIVTSNVPPTGGETYDQYVRDWQTHYFSIIDIESTDVWFQIVQNQLRQYGYNFTATFSNGTLSLTRTEGNPYISEIDFVKVTDSANIRVVTEVSPDSDDDYRGSIILEDDSGEYIPIVDLQMLGEPTAPTAPASSNNTVVANTAFVKSAIQGFPKKEIYTNPALTVSDGKATWTITHTLGNSDCLIQVQQVADGRVVFVDSYNVNSTTIRIEFTTDANIDVNTYKAILLG